MIPWVQIYSNLPQHRKTSRLAEELKLSSAAVDPNIIAVGILVSLWTWAIQNAYDGDLSECSPRTIANACQWRKKPEALVQALVKTGWLDEDLRLHDWEEYAVLLIDQTENRKAKTRERVRKYRGKKMQGLFCAYCGDRATGYDHIVPVSSGGTDDPDNLVPCCPDCNREKNNRPLADFMNTSRKMKRELVEQNEQIMRHVTVEQGRYIPQCVTLRNAPTIPYITGKKTHLLTEMSKRNPANAAQEAGTNALSPEARAVIADYLDRVNPSASETSLRMLASYADAMGEAVCKKALDVALDEHKATWSYIRAILQAKMSAGVKSLADWDRSEQQRSSGKQENSRPSKPTKGPGPAAIEGPSAQEVRDSQAWMREILAMDKAREGKNEQKTV